MHLIKSILLILFISYIICLLPINKYFKICYYFDTVREKDKLECDYDKSYSRSILCKNPLREYIPDFNISDFNIQLVLFILLMYYIFIK